MAVSQISFWQVVWVAVFISAVIVAVTLVGYHLFFYSKVAKFGVVDLESVLETNQLMLMDKVSGGSVTDQDRLSAFNAAKDFGKDLDKALNQIKSECGCSILVSSALIVGETKDYTTDIKEMLGLDKVNVDLLKQKMSDQLSKK